MWNLRYAPAATAGMRKVPRGVAANVTAAIGELQRIPLPYGATPEPTGKPNTYVISEAGYTITYEMVEVGQIVRVLSVEEE
jgi:hypothetical protein